MPTFVTEANREKLEAALNLHSRSTIDPLIPFLKDVEVTLKAVVIRMVPELTEEDLATTRAFYPTDPELAYTNRSVIEIEVRGRLSPIWDGKFETVGEALNEALLGVIERYGISETVDGSVALRLMPGYFGTTAEAKERRTAQPQLL